MVSNALSALKQTDELRGDILTTRRKICVEGWSLDANTSFIFLDYFCEVFCALLNLKSQAVMKWCVSFGEMNS